MCINYTTTDFYEYIITVHSYLRCGNREDAKNAWSCTKTRDIKPNCYGNSWENNSDVIIIIIFCARRVVIFIIPLLNTSEHEACFVAESCKIIF